MCFVYPRWEIDSAKIISWLPVVLVGVSLAVLFWQRKSWGRPVLFGVVYFGLMLSPMLGFFNIYYMRYSYVADHYQYMALPGLLGLLVCGIRALRPSSVHNACNRAVGDLESTASFFNPATAVMSCRSQINR